MSPRLVGAVAGAARRGVARTACRRAELVVDLHLDRERDDIENSAHASSERMVDVVRVDGGEERAEDDEEHLAPRMHGGR
jgi:hypothetical protein